MKTIKIKITNFLAVFFSLLVLLISQAAKAQDNDQDFKNKTPEQRAQMQTNMMKTKLNLDSGQTLKVQAINLKYAQQLAPVLKSDEGKFAKLRQMKSIMGQKDKDLKVVFSADQYKQYKTMEAEMKDKMRDYAKSRN